MVTPSVRPSSASHTNGYSSQRPLRPNLADPADPGAGGGPDELVGPACPADDADRPAARPAARRAPASGEAATSRPGPPVAPQRRSVRRGQEKRPRGPARGARAQAL